MDHYSNAELTTFLFLAWEDLDRQFYFWITVTFATIVAAFAADDRFRRPLRYVAAALYVLAAVILYIRYMVIAEAIGQLRLQLISRDALVSDAISLTVGTLTPILRQLIFLVGTIAAVYVLLGHSRRSDSEISNRRIDAMSAASVKDHTRDDAGAA
jgi:hypothetical protein